MAKPIVRSNARNGLPAMSVVIVLSAANGATEMLAVAANATKAVNAASRVPKAAPIPQPVAKTPLTIAITATIRHANRAKVAVKAAVAEVVAKAAMDVARAPKVKTGKSTVMADSPSWVLSILNRQPMAHLKTNQWLWTETTKHPLL